MENQQYTGCTVNGKSTTVSYKVHKVIKNPKEEYQIIPNTQEAIIDENVWLRVQELRKNKRRPTKTNRKSLFSRLVFCTDCKSKLHFCAAKSLKRNQEFFRCANYKDGRGSCTIHFIRDVVLEMIVKEAVAGLADFVRCYESVFLYMQKQKCGEFQKKRQQELKLSMESSRKRIADLDKLFSRIYEDKVIGKLSDERYARMAAEYESEQKELLDKVREEEKQLSEMEQKSVDMRLLLQGLREFTDMRELTPTIVNKLIRRIEVHNPEKTRSKIGEGRHLFHSGGTGEPSGRAGNPENDGADAKHITDTETAHRIKRKRCNPQKIGLHHFRYFLLPYQHRAFSVRDFCCVLSQIF